VDVPWLVARGDFNFDFNVSVTESSSARGRRIQPQRARPPFDAKPKAAARDSAKFAAMVGTDVATTRRERPGMSAFALEDGVVYHTYSTYARGLDGLWGMYQWLDRAPRGATRRRLVAPPRRVRGLSGSRGSADAQPPQRAM